MLGPLVQVVPATQDGKLQRPVGGVDHAGQHAGRIVIQDRHYALVVEEHVSGVPVAMNDLPRPAGDPGILGAVAGVVVAVQQEPACRRRLAAL